MTSHPTTAGLYPNNNELFEAQKEKGAVNVLPENYVGQIGSGQHVIFMEKIHLPMMTLANTSYSDTQKQYLSFSRRRNQTRTKRHQNFSAHALMRVASSGQHGTRVYEEASNLNTDWDNHQRYNRCGSHEFGPVDTHLTKRKRLITFQEYHELLTDNGRSRFRQTNYVCLPKSNLELIWKNYGGHHGSPPSPIDFFGDILQHGTLITSTSHSRFNATQANTFSTNALSGVARSNTYRNARGNAYLVHHGVFSKILHDNRDIWANHGEHSAAFREGQNKLAKVRAAIVYADSKHGKLQTAFQNIKKASGYTIYQIGVDNAAHQLLQHGLRFTLNTAKAILNIRDKTNSEAYHQWTTLLNLVGAKEGVLAPFTYEDLSDSDWKEAHDFAKNADDLADAASEYRIPEDGLYLKLTQDEFTEQLGKINSLRNDYLALSTSIRNWSFEVIEKADDLAHYCLDDVAFADSDEDACDTEQER